MSYPLNNRNSGGARKLSPYIIIVFFLVISFIGLKFFSGPISETLNTAVSPMWKVKSFFVSKVNNNSHFLKSKKSLLEENRLLKSELSKFEIDSLVYSSVFSENEELKSFLGRFSEENKVLSSVLSKPPVSPYDSLIIDVGSDHNLKVNDQVKTLENLVIGRVEEVYARTSKVTLFSSPGLNFQAENIRNSLSIEVSGRGGGNFKARMPEDSDFEVGDVIVIPGLKISVLGTVLEIKDDPTSSFKDLYIKSPISIFELKNVVVEISN